MTPCLRQEAAKANTAIGWVATSTPLIWAESAPLAAVPMAGFRFCVFHELFSSAHMLPSQTGLLSGKESALGFPGGSAVKNLPARQEIQAASLSREDPLEEGMATHSSILAWRIPWTEAPGGLQSTRLHRVGHDRNT